MTEQKNDKIEVDGKKEASLLLAGLDPQHRERILSEIAEKDPKLAATLRKGLYDFHQVLALEPLELSLAIRSFSSDFFALALRGIDAEQKKMLYSKLPERQSRAIEEEIQSIGPQKLSDVKQARETILANAVKLHEKGEVHLK